MPFRRKATKKSSSARKSKKPIQNVRIVRPRRMPVKTYAANYGLPLVKRTKLVYRDAIGLGAVSGSQHTFTFNMNSPYDPQTAAGGHQPYGYDQWATLYNNYRVISSKVTVRWLNIATNSIPHWCFAILDKDNSISNNLDTKLERTQGKGMQLLAANSNARATTTAYFNAKQFFDVTDVRDEPDLSAAMNANPARLAYCVIGIQPMDSASSSSQFVYGDATVEYDIELYNPITPAGST